MFEIGHKWNIKYGVSEDKKVALFPVSIFPEKVTVSSVQH